MKLEMKDKGRYMDGNTPRNVMFSVYPSGSEWKVSGFGMVREPGLVSWKYFTYPLSAFRGIKTQRNHAIWLCLDFLAEERTETVCLPGLSNVSEVERTLREYMADRDKPATGNPLRQSHLPRRLRPQSLRRTATPLGRRPISSPRLSRRPLGCIGIRPTLCIGTMNRQRQFIRTAAAASVFWERTEAIKRKTVG